eukprot:4464361-Alexandrium_andersonii.AAC.1
MLAKAVELGSSRCARLRHYSKLSPRARVNPHSTQPVTFCTPRPLDPQSHLQPHTHSSDHVPSRGEGRFGPLTSWDRDLLGRGWVIISECEQEGPTPLWVFRPMN